jgi:hypothetical protein
MNLKCLLKGHKKIISQSHTHTPDLRSSRVSWLCESSGVECKSETGPLKDGTASLFRCIFPAVASLEKC